MGEFNEAQVAAIKHKKGPMLVQGQEKLQY